MLFLHLQFIFIYFLIKPLLFYNQKLRGALRGTLRGALPRHDYGARYGAHYGAHLWCTGHMKQMCIKCWLRIRFCMYACIRFGYYFACLWTVSSCVADLGIILHVSIPHLFLCTCALYTCVFQGCACYSYTYLLELNSFFLHVLDVDRMCLHVVGFTSFLLCIRFWHLCDTVATLVHCTLVPLYRCLVYLCVPELCFYGCASCTSALHARPVCSRAVHSVLVHRLVPWQPDLFILHLCFSIWCMLYLCVPDSCFTLVSSVLVCCERCIVYYLCIPDMCIRWWHLSVNPGLSFLVHSALSLLIWIRLLCAIEVYILV